MTFEKIRELIVDQLGIDEDMVEMDTNLMKDLEGDSLDMVEIILGIEETFGLEIPDEEAEKFVLQRYIISQYQERCRKKLKQGYRKNEKEAFWEFLAKRPEILNKNTVKAISEKEFKNELKKADNKVQGYMIGSNGWFKDCFYAGEMKTLAVYLEKYLEELDFSMIFNEKGGILQYVTSDEGKVEREYCRLI